MKSLADLPPDLKVQVAKALGAPRSEDANANDTPFNGRQYVDPHPDAVGNAVSVPENPPPDAPRRDPPEEDTEGDKGDKEAKEETPQEKRVREALELKKKGKMIDPFSKAFFAHAIEVEQEIRAEQAEIAERQRRRNLRRRRPKK